MSEKQNKNKRKHSDDESASHEEENPTTHTSTTPDATTDGDADKNATTATNSEEAAPEVTTKSADATPEKAPKTPLSAESVKQDAPAASGSAEPSPSKVNQKSPQEKQELLDQLKAEITNDNNLPLGGKNAKLVFGRGSASADIVFIGEAPGEQEEKTGIPFVGPAGKKLDSLLAGIGLNADKIYICNVLKYRPPDNRDPNAKEVQLHTPYLLRQLTIIAPKLIVPMGNWASKYVLSGFDPKGMNKIDGMQKTHGKRSNITSPDGEIFEVLPSLHPAAVLHQERYDPDIKFDFEKIKEYINSEEFKEPKKKNTGPSPAKKQKTIMSFFTPKK